MNSSRHSSSIPAALFFVGVFALAPRASAQAVASVSAGNSHTMFVKTDGTLWATGNDGWGQLGDGATTDRHAPVQVASGVASVAAGSDHTMFVKKDGTLWAMGDNDSGQLGDGTTTARSTPVQVAGGVASVVAGNAFTMFVKTDGTLWATGFDGSGQLGDNSPPAGPYFRTAPVQVANGVASVSAGDAHTMFVKTDGTLWAMGDNSKGQLGDGTTTIRRVPVQVAGGVASVAAGFDHTMFVKTDGTLWGVGCTDFGELGDGTTPQWLISNYRSTPVQVAGGVASVAAGSENTMFVKTDGTLWATGYDNVGQLGNGTPTSPFYITRPVKVAGGVASVAAGDSHTTFVKTDGTLWATGSNDAGQLGDGTTTTRSTPVQVFTLASAPPSFATQPANQTVTVGGNASFTVAADGNPAPGLQWQLSADSGSTWSDVPDRSPYSEVKTSTLTITAATAAMTGLQYRCVASNGVGPDATSNAATLIVTPAAPTVDPASVVTSSGFSATWNAVTGATGYRLDVSTDSSFSSFVPGYQNLDVGDLTSVSVTGLAGTTTYYYRVRSYNGAGIGISSNTVTVTTAIALPVSTLAGQALTFGSTDGTGSGARFYYPSGIAADNAGNLYVADTDNDAIRKVTPAGVVTTLAGLAGVSGSANGTGSAARFQNPSGIAVDSNGNIYVADTLNNTLRMVTVSGIVTTIAGTSGAGGAMDGTGASAQFQGPQGLTIDQAGNLYIADTNNHTIRKLIPSTGTVTTIAGVAGTAGSNDGTGTAARFNYPSGVAVDSAGNVYVADTDNDDIRRITPSGLVSTIAGAAGAARFDSPSALAADTSGNLYVADTGNFTIRKVVAATRVVSTIAGLAGTSGSADGAGSTVRFFAPTGIAADSSGNLYIADTNNHTIRLGLLPTAPSIQTQPQSQTVTAGGSVQFSVTASGRPTPAYQWYFNGLAINGATASSYSLAGAQYGNAGNYTVTVTNGMGTVVSNIATLTVNAVDQPPTGGGGSGGGGGGGGGGAPSLWFILALALVGIARGWSVYDRSQVRAG